MLDVLRDPPDREAVRIDGRSLSYEELSGAAAALAEQLAGTSRAALWATPALETVIGLAGGLAARTTLVPVNPGSGERELEHVIRDSDPELVIAARGEELPSALGELPRITPSTRPAGAALREAVIDPEAVTFVLYTSGTTGPPKGVQIPRRAIESNLAALARAWDWTGADRLAHALPLFHVHGLILGVLGPLRLGGAVEHVGRFSPAAIAQALDGGATMLFGVPTMYHRLADEAERDPTVADALSKPRLLVSGSAALPASLHRRIERLCGQRVVERYGMTETLMITATRADGERRAGYVGRPVDGVEVRLLDEGRQPIESSDDEQIGEIAVRSDALFAGYLHLPEATSDAFCEGWFMTGDLATRAADGYLRLVGRRSTDMIKSGGYRIGAGEVEAALLEHPAVAEAAVRGMPDEDLGERVVAWVVPRDRVEPIDGDALIAHAARLLSAHKRPREVHLVAELPRNAMGKVLKQQLRF